MSAATLSGWRDAFLAAGEAILRKKPATGEELESERLKAKLGRALIECDLLHEKIAILKATALWPDGISGDEPRHIAGDRPMLRARYSLPSLAALGRVQDGYHGLRDDRSRYLSNGRS